MGNGVGSNYAAQREAIIGGDRPAVEPATTTVAAAVADVLTMAHPVADGGGNHDHD